ncbi:PBP/GOBP family [Popillia japonica]|uniref:PBP/GOBP family n=1 Tax=Popillia japonica TaxID=7064 RepID=A0AAW1I9H4_POPJA
MKQFVVFAVLCVIVSVQALTDEQKAKVKQVSEKCIASSGADPASVEKGRKDENADVRLDKVKEKISNDLTEAQIETLFATCKPKATVPVDKAAEFWKCYWANTPKRIELV